jgi:soluble lytic murein transglycosylase
LVQALLARFEVAERPDRGQSQLAALDRLAAREPLVPLVRALILRKLDRDAEAAQAAEAFANAHPEHPLAPFARAQAATLYRALGDHARAEPLDQALASGSAGDLQRGALWRLGFAATGARGKADPVRAEKYLRTLEERYGGEIDRYGLVWFERARYWRARAAHSAGDTAAAAALWRGLIGRFPAGWYALLARDHVGALAGEDAREIWSVARDDVMATALALYRLGAESDALRSFQALLDARVLPGNGRKLLADLLEVAGESAKAARVLRFAAVPATMPGDDSEATGAYTGLYPILHTEALGAAADGHQVPKALLAGVISAETGFNARSHSAPGAMGLAQLMPGTGKTIGKRLFGPGFRTAQLWDPATNLAIAATYLKGLLERFENHPAIAVAAYNAGPAPVQAWLAARGHLPLDAFVETIPFEQARRSVMRVFSDAEIYRRLYQLDPHPIALPRSVTRLSP